MLLGDLNEWDGVKWVNVTLRVKDTLLAPPPRQDAGVAILERFLYVYGGTGVSGGERPAGSLETVVYKLTRVGLANNASPNFHHNTLLPFDFHVLCYIGVSRC